MKPTIIPESLLLLPLTTAPSSPVEGQIYLDGTQTPAQYRIYANGAWSNLTAPVSSYQSLVNQSIPNSTDTLVSVNDTIVSNVGVLTTSSPFLWTCNATGIYRISFFASFSLGGAALSYAFIRKNGASAIAVADTEVIPSTNTVTLNANGITSLVSGDTLELLVYQNVGSAQDLSTAFIGVSVKIDIEKVG